MEFSNAFFLFYGFSFDKVTFHYLSDDLSIDIIKFWQYSVMLRNYLVSRKNWSAWDNNEIRFLEKNYWQFR